MSAETMTSRLDEIARVRGVHAAVVTSERDGVPIESRVHFGLDGDAMTALVALAHRRLRVACEEASFGSVQFLHIETERAHLCATLGGGLLYLVLADAHSNVAQLRILLRRLAEEAAT